jgi:hypothetical protein
LARPPEPGFFLLAGLDVMLYDPLAVKRLASAVCVLPPTPRSRIGTSGCQGCESSSTTESSREPGLDAGAPGRLYCVPSQEEEQQRPVVGHGIVLEETSSQENLAQGKGRALGAERSSTEPFRKKDQATYLGAQRHTGGWGALPTSSLAHDRPRRQARASVVPLLAECLSLPLGATLLRPYGSSGGATARSVAGRLPRFRRKPRAARESRHKERRQGGEATLPTGVLSDPQSPQGDGGRTARRAGMLSRLAQAVVSWCSHD